MLPWVSRRAFDVLQADRDRLLADTVKQSIQIQKLTDSIAVVNRVPPPFREIPITRGGMKKASAPIGVFQRQKALERQRQDHKD